VTQGLWDLKVPKVTQDLQGLKALKVHRDQPEMTELMARLCSVEPSIRKQATVSTETSTSIPRQTRSLARRRVVPGEQALPLSDHREHKVRKGHRVNKGCRVSREFREFKALREMLEPRDLPVLKDLRVMSGRKDLLVLMEQMELTGRPC